MSIAKENTRTSITISKELKKELETIRKRGYSLDNEEYGHGIICMSVPIFDHTKTVIGVIGCSLSTVYCSVEEIYDRCGRRLMQTAEQISKCMGCVFV